MCLLVELYCKNLVLLIHSAPSLLLSENSALGKLTNNSKSSRKTKNRHYVQRNKFRQQTLFDDYAQEFAMYNVSGIDFSLVVAYHCKFHHLNKKQQLYFICWYVCFRRHQSLT